LIMSSVPLIDDQITVLGARPLGAVFPKLTHSLKLDTRGSRNMAPSAPRVFISYSHDSLEHARRVMGLAERLRKDGVDAQLDQYVAGTPARGWPRWMEDQLDSSEFVLVICTQTYRQRFLGREEPDKGKGAVWEGSLITLELYHTRSDTNKFVPVLFDRQDEPFIPRPLSGHTHYLLSSEDNYAKLYAFLTGQAGVLPGKLGPLKTRAREAVEPLTFGGPGEETPAAGKLDGVLDRPSRYLPQETDSDELRSSGSRPSSEGALSQERWREIALYGVISLISFLCGVVLLGLMILNADLLGRLGLTGNLYYLVLLPMGLAAAGFLFGVLRSYARYRGKQLGGMLELSGPIVAFLLVVILGFVLVKPITTFPMTVYVHGEASRQDIVLRNSGYVLLDLGGDRRRQPIGADGQAYFHEIPANFLGQEVPISVDSDAFEVIETKQKLRLDGSSIYLPVQRKAGHLSGWVKDEKGNPVPGATVNIAGLSKVTDSAGYFEFDIPGHQMQGELQLEALALGYAPVNLNSVVPGGNPLTIQLQRTP
jgi:SEFIR domain/Carboxypeptidase regulatory-like domain